MHLITRTGTVLAAAVLAAVPIMAAGPASAAPDAGASAASARGTGVPNELMAALQRDLGLSADQVKQRLAQQAKAIEADRSLQARLGSTFAGSWFDATSGKLVVAVTDQQSAQAFAPAGVQIRKVKHSKAHLDGIKAELDALAGKTAANPTVRSTKNKRPALQGLTSWYVDTKSNSVVITALAGQPRSKALDLLAKHGDAVRIEYTTTAPQPATNFMDGGDMYNGFSCSAGFNLRNHATGQGYLLTAGHCVTGGSNLIGQDGTFFGPVLESWFDFYDDAIVRNDNAGYWIQGPWVDTNPSNGNVLSITGVTDAPQGTTVCKSGITTLLTCGSITGKDVTVNFFTGDTVFGETQHSACVERGDSGGSNFAVTDAYTAEGVTSGAILFGPGAQCGANVGQPTTSWYFPIADSLGYYGSVYGVAIW